MKGYTIKTTFTCDRTGEKITKNAPDFLRISAENKGISIMITRGTSHLVFLCEQDYRFLTAMLGSKPCTLDGIPVPKTLLFNDKGKGWMKLSHPGTESNAHFDGKKIVSVKMGCYIESEEPFGNIIAKDHYVTSLLDNVEEFKKALQAARNWVMVVTTTVTEI